MSAGFMFAMLCLTSTAQAAPYPKLVLAGPTAAVSFPLIHMVETGALAEWADEIEFRHWKNPDQLRVLLAKQQVDFSAAPVNLPAIMANRGLPVRLLNVSVWGLLWFVSSDPAIQSVQDLAGQPLLTTFQRDLPALLLERLLAAKDLTGEQAPIIRYARDAQDATALMLTGEAPTVLLPEPSVSLLLARNTQVGDRDIRRVQNLEDAWRDAFPQQPDLPQAGIMVNTHRAADTALSQAVAQAYAEATQWCKDQPAECAAEVHRHLDFMPVDAIEASIRVTRLDSHNAKDIRPALEGLYQLILDHNPEAVGGQLPALEFYGP